MYCVLFLELLRKTSEHVLIDMVQLLFARLPQFKDDAASSASTKRVRKTESFDFFILFIQCFLY